MLETINNFFVGRRRVIKLFHTKSLACFDNIGSEPQKKDDHGGHGWQEILSSSSGGGGSMSSNSKMSNPRLHMSMVVHRFTR
jgi:hypothetical protein